MKEACTGIFIKFIVMKKYLLPLLLLCCFAAPLQAQQYPGIHRITYYHFEEDIQMVEIFFFDDIRIPKSNSEPHSFYTQTPPTIYLFRDKTGKILTSYNWCGATLNMFSLKDPDSIDPESLKTHESTRYPYIENCRVHNLPQAIDDTPNTRPGHATGQCGLIDQQGKIIVQAKYQSLWELYHLNIFAFTLNNKSGLIDGDGNILQPAKYDTLEGHHHFGNYIFRVSCNNKYSYIDSTGKIFSKREYDFGNGFWSRRARVGIGGKYGFIDSTGTEVVALQYPYAEDFYYNVAIVGDGKKFGMINNQGGIIEPIAYDSIRDVMNEKEMRPKGYMAIKAGQQYFFDLAGKPVKSL
jgi:WG containing repeat